MKNLKTKYSNGEITVVWEPAKCIHASHCWKDSPNIFKPQKKPWIDLKEAKPDDIIKQIRKCPSGALSYYFNDGENIKPENSVKQECLIEILENGPLLVYGNIELKNKKNKEFIKSKVTAFCRCGHSKNKPYCDGAHLKVNFTDNSK